MIESLRRHAPGAAIYVLALDQDACRAAQQLPDCKVLGVADLEDAAFLAARNDRSHEEFCWTCAPVLCHYILSRAADGEFAAYVDADLFFYTDPATLFAEMGERDNILIHRHNYSPDMIDRETTSGIFNVGFVGFRVSEEARACAARWRDQVLALCTKDPTRGLCGDQGYLNEWPALYPGLRIMDNIGGGVAPWNVNDYAVTGTVAAPRVKGVPVVFFHFHQLRVVSFRQWRFIGIVPALGYHFNLSVLNLFYRGYAFALRQAAARLDRIGVTPPPEMLRSARAFSIDFLTGRYEPVNSMSLVALSRYLSPLGRALINLRRMFGARRAA